jgi:hypothetical protein
MPDNCYTKGDSPNIFRCHVGKAHRLWKAPPRYELGGLLNDELYK